VNAALKTYAIAETAAPAGRAFAVRRLTLTDFRNWSSLRVEFGVAPVVLTGPNGAGKTNLLEALSFLAPGRGLRRAKLGQATRHGTDTGWAVNARLDASEGAAEVGTGLVREEGASSTGERRQVRLDGRATQPVALAALGPVSWLTPSMDRLFVEAASGRRRFLDRLVYGDDPDHARRVASYDTALRERAKLLAERRGDASWLGALEAQMAEHGIAIACARAELVARLDVALAEDSAPFPSAALTLAGEVECWIARLPALGAEDAFRDALAAARARDAEAGGAAVGPHRSDLVVTHRARGVVAAECSTGEQKALLLSIVLADARLTAARRGLAPLLLLDEVAAHLDGVRRDALFDRLRGLGAQAWLTGTDSSLFQGLARQAQCFDVRDGTLRPTEIST
jgi:DNA replication and repair protein RecF